MQSTKCNIIWKDDPPYVYHAISGFNEPKTQIIDYSFKQFNSVPLILLGISHYDYQNQPTQIVDVKITSFDINKSNCKILVENDQKNKLYGIEVSLVAIDVSQFPFINIINTEILNLQSLFQYDNTNDDYYYEKEFIYSPSILNMEGEKNINVVLRGYKSDPYTKNDSRIKVAILVTSNTQSSYKIKILSKKNSIKIQSVYFSILEFIENPNSIYGLEHNQHSLFQNSNCINFSDGCIIDINVSNDTLPKQNQKPLFFASINQIDFVTTAQSRIRLKDFSLISSRTFQYKYSVWADSQSFGSITTFLFFYQKQCQPSSDLFNLHDKACVSNCVLIEKFPSEICLDCKKGEFLNVSKKTCSVNKPPGTCCERKSDYKQCFELNDCDECKKINDSQIICTKCEANNYLLNERCLSSQPENAYCDNYICLICPDPSCLKCTNPLEIPSKCLQCRQGKYLFDGKCMNQKPPNTYCVPKNIYQNENKKNIL